MNPQKEQGPDADPGPTGPGSLARNSIFGIIAGVGSALGSVLASIIVAHTLGVEGTGVVAFALLVVMAASTIADLGIQSSLTRYLPELIGAGMALEAHCLSGYLLRALAAASCVALAGFVLYGVWDWRVGGAPPEEALIWVLIGIGCTLRTLAGFGFGHLRGLQRFDTVAQVTAISFVVQLAGVAFGSMWFGAAGALGGYCSGSVVPAVLCVRHFRHMGPPSPEIRVRVRRYAFFCWANSLAATFVWSRAEILFLQRSCGSAAVGLFSVGLTLANVASAGPILLTSALLPYFAQNVGKGEEARSGLQETCLAATRVLAFLIFPICFGMAAVVPVALPLLYGQAFSDAVPAAIILLIATGLASTTSVAGHLIMAMDRSDLIFYSGAAAAALMVAAGFTIIPIFGLIGAAWVRAIIQLLMGAFAVWVIVSRLGISLPFKDLGKILLAAALCGGTARALLWLITGAASLPIAVLAGIAIYIASIRTIRGLPTSDLDWLRRASRGLPVWSHRAIDLGFRLITPYPPETARLASSQSAPQQPPADTTTAAQALATVGAARNAN